MEGGEIIAETAPHSPAEKVPRHGKNAVISALFQCDYSAIPALLLKDQPAAPPIASRAANWTTSGRAAPKWPPRFSTMACRSWIARSN